MVQACLSISSQAETGSVHIHDRACDVPATSVCGNAIRVITIERESLTDEDHGFRV